MKPPRLVALGVAVLAVLWISQRVGTNTLFSLAASEDNKPLMLIALRLGADIEAREDGRTALLYAIEANQKSTVAHLLQLGANPNVAYPYGVTALEAARGERFLEIAALLLRYGAREKVKFFAALTEDINGSRAAGDL